MRSLAHRPSVWVVSTLLVLIAVIAVWRARGPRVVVTQPVRQNLEQHVVASGRVRVPTRISISAQLSGLVIAVGAVEGQHVRAGELLLQLDDAEARAAVAQAKAATAQAAARVEQLRRVGAIVATEAYRQADTNLERAQAELARISKLTQSGALATTELDEARRRLDIARAQKSAAEAQQVSAAPLGADSRVALSALLQSQAQLTGANVRLDQTRITAPQDGTILSREVEPGDVVQPGRVLLVLAADGGSELVMTPDERNLAFIHLGQRARASADAFPETVFEAEVSYLAPAVDPQRGSIEVRLSVSNPPPFLRPDMTVSIDLTVSSRAEVLTLPSEAIRGAGTPAPWVFVVERGRLARREIKLGIHGDGATEIIAGLDEHAEVLVADAREAALGQRVRAERTVSSGAN